MPAASTRLVSIDVLRGLTIALMILVNDPGDWTHTYHQLDHAPWNGFTLTDFVFPNFLFLVGVSIILSMHARLTRPGATPLNALTRRTLTLRILRRAALIFAIKMFLSAYPHFHLTHLRLFGVLTRIALCYLAAALICLYTQRARILLAIAAALLVGYWALMRLLPVPGTGGLIPTHGLPILDPDHNLAALLDRAFNAFTRRWLHTGNLYNHTHDPEGLLSTLPAIATTLIGCTAGLLLTKPVVLSEAPERASGERNGAESKDPEASRTHRSSPNPFGHDRIPDRRSAWMGFNRQSRSTPTLLLAGVLSLAAGLAWNPFFPINKNLWTSSYVLFAAGWSLLLLAAAHWLFDSRRLHETPIGRALTLPWLVFGSNAIFAYILSNLIVETALAIHLTNPADPTHPLTAWSWPYAHLFAAHGSTNNTSLAFALTFTALCWLPNLVLWRRRIFLRL